MRNKHIKLGERIKVISANDLVSLFSSNNILGAFELGKDRVILTLKNQISVSIFITHDHRIAIELLGDPYAG